MNPQATRGQGIKVLDHHIPSPVAVAPLKPLTKEVMNWKSGATAIHVGLKWYIALTTAGMDIDRAPKPGLRQCAVAWNEESLESEHFVQMTNPSLDISCVVINNDRVTIIPQSRYHPDTPI